MKDAFELYHKTRESRLSSEGTALPALGHAVAGAAGSAVSNLCTYPLDLIITRLQIQRRLRNDLSEPGENGYRGLRDAVEKIFANEGGVSGFYTGVLSDTGKTIADSFLFFLTYNFLRQRRIMARDKGSSAAMLPAIEELAVGFAAGGFTKLLTTPIANIVTRKQASALTSSPPPPSARIRDSSSSSSISTSPSASQIARDILDQKGPLGFWSGYSASLILTLNPSLTFFLFETFKRLLPRAKRDNPPAAAIFFMAATSKACASAITYPFSIAKSRAQAGGKDEQESEEEAGEKMKGASGAALSSGRNQRMAAKTTIFSTLLLIAQTEGIQGLYEGLHLEVAKGFFNHGITMIVKQMIHRMIIQAYYVLSVIVSQLRRRAKPEKLEQRAREQSYEYYDLARVRALEKVMATKDQLQTSQKGDSGALSNIADGVKGVMDRANETAELVADYVEEEAEEWRTLYGTGLARWFEEK